MEAAERMSRRSSRSVSQVYKGDSELDLRRLLKVLQAIRDGDFSVRLPGDKTGLPGKVADLVNEIAATNQRLAREIERAGQLVGKDGRTRHRITAERRSGSWGAMESSLNTLIDDLVWPTAEATRTISAVAKGDLSQLTRLEVDGRPIKGEFLRSATIVNSMIEQMRGFTSEVTRVAREVGTEGKLGGQAFVPGAAGTWKDLTDNVNSMAGNLTDQVRNIAGTTSG
jgi:methyl-accepting chemotaxis protein